MDERELSTLFRAAPGDPPAPAFDLADITAASARARTRRRFTQATAAAGVVIALAGFGVTRIDFGGTMSGTSQVAGQGQPAKAPGPVPYAATPSPLPGSDSTGEAGPRAESAPGCDKVDRELATALAGELPGTGANAAEPGRFCPAESRSAGFQVTAGDSHGFLSVTLAPPGNAIPPDSTGAVAQEPASSGGSLIVFSIPDPGSAPPLQTDLDRIARALAARF